MCEVAGENIKEEARFMPEKLSQFLGQLPFLMLATGEVKINKTRIIEAIIYAVVGGLLAGFVSVKVMEVKIAELEKKVDRIYGDIYRPYIPQSPEGQR